MAVETQVKLLRLLEEGTFERVGSSETRMAQTRIVAATNRDLKEMVSMLVIFAQTSITASMPF